MNNKVTDLINGFKEVFSETGIARDTIKLDEIDDKHLSELLMFLDANIAANIFAMLPAERKFKIIKQIASAGDADIDVDFLFDIKESLNKNLDMSKEDVSRFVGDRTRKAAMILNYSKESVEFSIMQSLEAEDTELAGDIDSKLFIFEDLMILRPLCLQEVLKEVDYTTIAVSLSSADEKVKEYVFANLSKNAVECIKDDIAYMGPIRKVDIDDARNKMVTKVRELKTAGHILVDWE